MTRIIFTSLLSIIGCMTYAQGIQFEHNLSWEQIKEKAKTENKFIFLDCYATWCAPCKFMSDSIFSQKEVGDYMNAHFINVNVQADETVKDGENIRNWRVYARFIVKKFSVEHLPTYLFFSPDGRVVHRVIGATGSMAMDFVAKAQDALDPDKEFYTLIENYKIHLHDSAYLYKALSASIKQDDLKDAEYISDAYLSCLINPFTVNNLNLINASIQSSNDKGFNLFLDNCNKTDSVFQSSDEAERKISIIISKEQIIPLFSNHDSPIIWTRVEKEFKAKYPTLNELTLQMLYDEFQYQILNYEIRIPLYKLGCTNVNWANVSTKIRKRFPGYNPAKMIAKEKPRYFSEKKMWTECTKSALSYINKYGSQLNNSELNSITWDYVFMHSNDRNSLLNALEWSKRTIPDSTNSFDYKSSAAYQYMDTYANLLYKINLLFGIETRGNAIYWEKKSLELLDKYHSYDPSAKINYKITLQRMENGEKTWEGRDERYEEYQ